VSAGVWTTPFFTLS